MIVRFQALTAASMKMIITLIMEAWIRAIALMMEAA
jgi:hypothetical protein